MLVVHAVYTTNNTVVLHSVDDVRASVVSSGVEHTLHTPGVGVTWN